MFFRGTVYLNFNGTGGTGMIGLALFVYTRPEHTKKVLESVKRNGFEKIYIFQDGNTEWQSMICRSFPANDSISLFLESFMISRSKYGSRSNSLSLRGRRRNSLICQSRLFWIKGSWRIPWQLPILFLSFWNLS